MANIRNYCEGNNDEVILLFQEPPEIIIDKETKGVDVATPIPTEEAGPVMAALFLAA